MNEAETRAEHIDKQLAAAGWGVVEGSRIRREYPITPGRIEGFGRRGKPLIADYVLEYRNRKLAELRHLTVCRHVAGVAGERRQTVRPWSFRPQGGIRLGARGSGWDAV